MDISPAFSPTIDPEGWRYRVSVLAVNVNQSQQSGTSRPKHTGTHGVPDFRAPDIGDFVADLAVV
jgi:hypothetical protein